MIGKTKTTVLALTVISMLAAPLADAARLGRGRSSGMQRAAPTQNYRPAAPSPQQAPIQTPAPAQAAPKKGPGLGTAIAAGAAGVAAGYMLGHSNNAAAAPGQVGGQPGIQGTQQPAEPSFPWGTLALVGIVVLGAFWFFRRRNSAAAQQSSYSQQAEPQASSFPPIPPVGSGNAGYAPTSAAIPARLPDGTETPAFLRQAKATFLHLQSLNTPESVEEVRKYMTPELFQDLRNDIVTNGDIADFPQLECNLLEAAQEGNSFVASVRFSGTVSESVNAPAEPFAETWHYVKGQAVTDRWLVAGIQQS